MITNTQQQPETLKAEPLFGPAWPPLLIAGVLFAVSLVTLHEPTPAPQYWIAFVCVLAGLGCWGAAWLAVRKSRDMSHAGDLYHFCEDYISRVRGIFIDNPELSSSKILRHQLLPTAEEMATIGLHPTVQATLLGMRDGTHWLLQGAAHCGPSLKIHHLCMKPKGHDREVPALPVADALVELAMEKGAVTLRVDPDGRHLIIEAGWTRKVLRLTGKGRIS